jgi:8-oxo-dGTP pyrophosphatase MutT (NUDIX family)
MSPTAAGTTHAEVRDWLADQLDPLEAPMDALLREDIDLDPGMLAPPELPPAEAAVLIGLIEREAGLSVLLTLRSAELRNHSGQVAFPGGRADPGETPWQAAVREAHEEVGLDPGFVDLIGLSTRYQTRTNYLITPVVGLIRPGFDITPNPSEVAAVFETPFAYLMNPTNYEEQEWADPETGQQRRFFATTHDDRYIWGVTAGILMALRDRLYGVPVA